MKKLIDKIDDFFFKHRYIIEDILWVFYTIAIIVYLVLKFYMFYKYGEV